MEPQAMEPQTRDSPAPHQLVINQRLRGATVVLTVTGEIDSTSAAGQLRTAVIAALGEAHSADPETAMVVLDLTEVGFLSATGLSALVAAHRHAATRDEPLRIVVDHARPVLRPLQLTGLDRVLTLYHYLDDALTGRTPDH